MKTLSICVILVLKMTLAHGFLSWFRRALPSSRTIPQKALLKCQSFACFLKQEACLRDCQRGQAHGIGFCSSFAGAYAPFIEGYAGDYQKRYGNRYMDNLVIATLEGIFSAISNYCSSGAVIVCSFCGDGVDYKNILEAQNFTVAKIRENRVQVKILEAQIENLAAHSMQQVKMTVKALRTVRKYEEMLRQTDQILYWFSKRDDSNLFKKLFDQKIQGIQGGLEWIIWALDDMVRDLIGNDADNFCKFVPHYYTIQLKVKRVSAHLSAEAGTLYEIDDHGTIVMGASHSELLKKQQKFIEDECFKKHAKKSTNDSII